MVETKRGMTAEELASLPSGRGQRYELVNGELRTMAAAGFLHGETVGRATVTLGTFVLPRNQGSLCGAETGFLLQRDRDVVLAPDVAYVARDRLPPPDQRKGYLELAPDVVVEVVSRFDRWSEMRGQVAAWLRYGVKVVWVLDPETRTAEIWRAEGQIERRIENQELDAEPVLPGFRCSLSDLFLTQQTGPHAS